MHVGDHSDPETDECSRQSGHRNIRLGHAQGVTLVEEAVGRGAGKRGGACSHACLEDRAPGDDHPTDIVIRIQT